MGRKKTQSARGQEPGAGSQETAPDAHLAHISPDLRPLALPIDMVALDPKNARAHGTESLAGIKRSLSQFGQRKPVIFNIASGYLEAGHGTVMAARELGWKMIAVVRVEDDPKTATGFALADNRSAELSKWDDVALAAALGELKEAEGELFSDLLLAELELGTAPAPKKAAVLKRFGVSVELDTEEQQKGLFARLKREGFRVKLTKYDVRVDEGEGDLTGAPGG